MTYYILNENKNVIPAKDLMEWGKFFNEHNYFIVKKDFIDLYEISTVFIGTIYIMFETMIFHDGESDIYCQRYSTWEEAESGHTKAIEWLKNHIKELNELNDYKD